MAAPGSTTIQLPSRGAFYEGRIPEGRITIRKLLVAEYSLLEQSGGGIEKIDSIIRACATLPNAFDHGDLLMQDRLAILLALRAFTLGSKYTYQFRCQHCNAQVKHTIDIVEELNEKNPEDGLTEPILVQLPDAGVAVQMRFLRGRDEDRVAKYAKRIMMQSNDASDPSAIHRLALQLVSINGDGSQNVMQRESFVRTCTGADLIAMQDTVDSSEPGIDLEVFPDCRKCGATNRLTMPFTGEFFRPTRS